MNAKRTEFLGKLSRTECSKAVINIINKLGDQPCSSNLYRFLINRQTDGTVLKSLSHVQEISPKAIAVMHHIPSRFLLPNVVKIIIEEPEFFRTMICNLYENGIRSRIQRIHELFPMSRTRFPWTQNWLNRSVQGGPEHDR